MLQCYYARAGATPDDARRRVTFDPRQPLKGPVAAGTTMVTHRQRQGIRHPPPRRAAEQCGGRANGGIACRRSARRQQRVLDDRGRPRVACPSSEGVIKIKGTVRGRSVGPGLGWLMVGTDLDTGQFAVESIRRWWNTMGTKTYLGSASSWWSCRSRRRGPGSSGRSPRIWRPAGDHRRRRRDCGREAACVPPSRGQLRWRGGRSPKVPSVMPAQ